MSEPPAEDPDSSAESKQDPPQLPPPGWFPDPHQTGTRQMRYWDGAQWTDRYMNKPTGRLSAVISIAAGFVVAAAVVGAALIRRDADTPTAEFIGYIVGGLVIALLVPVVVRLIQIRFFNKGAKFYSPWVFASGAVLAVLVFGSAVSSEREENESTVSEATELTQDARAACEERGIEPFPKLEGGYRFRPVNQRFAEQLESGIPPGYEDVFEARFLADPGGSSIVVLAVPVADEAYGELEAGFSSGLTDGGETQTLSTGEEILLGEAAAGRQAGIFEGDCYSYMLGGQGIDPVPYAEAISASQ